MQRKDIPLKYLWNAGWYLLSYAFDFLELRINVVYLFQEENVEILATVVGLYIER